MDELKQDTDLIRALVDYADLTPAGVAKRAGVAVTTVNRPFNGSATTRLGRSSLLKLQKAFPGFPGWASNGGDVQSERDDDSDVIFVDHIDLRYGLGGTYLEAPVVAKRRAFPLGWIRLFTNAPPAMLFWAEGFGESMEPTIRSGEPVLIDRSQTEPRMGDGIWACAYGDVGMIKRLRPLPNGSVEIHSDNPHVPPALAVDGELHVIGRVVAVVRKL